MQQVSHRKPIYLIKYEFNKKIMFSNEIIDNLYFLKQITLSYIIIYWGLEFMRN